MDLGLAVAQYGAFASLGSVTAVATGAERIGYDSLWVGDRLLSPLRPLDRYPGGDGTIPPQHRTFLDPVAVLSVAAAVTERVRLGTSTLNACWYSPPLVARSFATLDRLSGGRAVAGFGLGWSREEYAANGRPWADRAARLDDMLDALEAIWTSDPVEYSSDRWTITPSTIEPKPQNLPVYLAGFAPAALRRVGRRADGWLTAALPLPMLTGMWTAIRQSAEEAGRDPDRLRMVLRCNPKVTGSPAPEGAVPRSGTVKQIAEYLSAAAEAGVHEILLDLQLTTTEDAELLDLAAAFHDALKG
ncbi:putative F420-dependent oxidoreductase [Thermocatellispora tengchongensis]|uniref:Putative F420-dependent oxidoreductase n=1 Tax=Thermocatellispora tengchongensis TaxID=1073253 RepID=A0A840PND8_9ACTN|nr:TIGR03619 family F420-dependent LLM class oxidoreductase [Thermocatellispora tengchongensis]MBB5138567.1 putative F420-dependent oxidoreductase [Thermocatellispora tengchongensis]